MCVCERVGGTAVGEPRSGKTRKEMMAVVQLRMVWTMVFAEKQRQVVRFKIYFHGQAVGTC